MNEQQLSQLEELAKAATPGPWYYRPAEYDDWGMVRAKPEPGRPYGYLTALVRAGGHVDEDHHRNEGTDPYEANATYIAAANPKKVLSLIAEIRRLRAATPSLPVQGEIAEGVSTEQLENLIHRAGKAYVGPYMVELTGTRHRFFTVNGGKHVLRKLMSEYELFELTAEAGSQLRATDAYMAAADPQTVTSMAQELLARRTSSPSLLVESKQEGWIELDEEQPDDEDSYLVCSRGKNGARIWIADWVPSGNAVYEDDEDEGDPEWVEGHFVNEDGDESTSVTHWMPLPAVPTPTQEGKDHA